MNNTARSSFFLAATACGLAVIACAGCARSAPAASKPARSGETRTPAAASPASHDGVDQAFTLQVLDKASGKPVRDAVVTVAGKVVAPEASGGFAIPSGTTDVMARAPGYRAITVPARQASGNKSTVSLEPFEVKALYLSEYGISSKVLRDPVFDIIAKGGANAVVVNIKSDHGMLTYPSDIKLAQEIGARKLTLVKSLPDLVKQGHEAGAYMIARIVTFKDDPLSSAHPEWAIRKLDGSLFKDREHLGWADPTQPAVRAYNIAIAVEAAKAGFDEVQFDYVRFPDAAAKMQFHGPTDEAGRINTITSFLTEAHQALAPYNVFHSADVFGYISWNTNDTGIGQQLDHLVANGTVDYLCPMLYPSGFKFGIPGHPNPLNTDQDIYNIIRMSLDNNLKRTNANPKKFRPWLQAFRDYAFNKRVFGAPEVAIQIKAADDAHADGWTLWNPGNHYKDAGLLK